MPYDVSANGPTNGANARHARGPLRPERLTSARSHVGGDTLTRLVQLTDLTILAGFIVRGWMHGDSAGVLGILAVASVLVAAALKSFEAYQLNARERLHNHVYKVIGA